MRSVARTVNTPDAPAAGSGTGTGTLFELTFDADFAAIDVEAFAAQVAMYLASGLECDPQEVQVVSLGRTSPSI